MFSDCRTRKGGCKEGADGTELASVDEDLLGRWKNHSGRYKRRYDPFTSVQVRSWAESTKALRERKQMVPDDRESARGDKSRRWIQTRR